MQDVVDKKVDLAKTCASPVTRKSIGRSTFQDFLPYRFLLNIISVSLKKHVGQNRLKVEMRGGRRRNATWF